MSVFDGIAQIDKALADCQYQSTNHSKDKILVYYGADAPITLCGFHAQGKVDFGNIRIDKENV